MDQPRKLRLRYSQKLIAEYKWNSGVQLFSFLERLDSKKFDDNGLLPKEAFIDKLYAQTRQCEGFGATLQDIREAMGKEHIQLYYSSDYGYLMSCYKKERLKLRNLLKLIDVMLK